MPPRNVRTTGGDEGWDEGGDEGSTEFGVSSMAGTLQARQGQDEPPPLDPRQETARGEQQEAHPVAGRESARLGAVPQT